MRFPIRPSKSFLYNFLERLLKSRTGAVGLDAAAAHLKNRGLFATDIYYGLDIDESALRAGLRYYPDPQARAIIADMTNLDALPDNSVDVVLSTFSLYHLPLLGRRKAAADLCRLTAPQGVCVLELENDQDADEIISLIETEFVRVEEIYFKNKLNQWLENRFERDGELGSHPILGAKPFRFLSWLFGLTEYLTRHNPKNKKHLLLIGQQKKGTVQKQPFDISHLRKLEDRLYTLM